MMYGLMNYYASDLTRKTVPENTSIYDHELQKILDIEAYIEKNGKKAKQTQGNENRA